MFCLTFVTQVSVKERFIIKPHEVPLLLMGTFPKATKIAEMRAKGKPEEEVPKRMKDIRVFFFRMKNECAQPLFHFCGKSSKEHACLLPRCFVSSLFVFLSFSVSSYFLSPCIHVCVPTSIDRGLGRAGHRDHSSHQFQAARAHHALPVHAHGLSDPARR